MEGGNRIMRVVMTMVMLSMILVAGAVDSITPDSGSGHEHKNSDAECYTKCNHKCSATIFVPIVYAVCMAVCGIGCKDSITPAVYNCTGQCTQSNIFKSNTADAVKVRSLVDACYKRCSNANV